MKRLIGFAVVAVIVAGCAPSNPNPVSAAAARALRPLVAALRDAAAGKSLDDVEGAEHALLAEVDALEQSNDLSTQRAKKIQDAATALLSDFRVVNQPPTTTPSDSSTATPTDTPTSSGPGPGPTVTITVPPTDTATANPTASDTSTSKGHGNGNGNGMR